MKRRSRGLVCARALTSIVLGLSTLACNSGGSSKGDDASGGTGGLPGTDTSVSSSGGSVGTGQPGVGDTDIGLPTGTPAGGTTSSSGTPASVDANCGKTVNELVKKPADLLLVLDRSSSMTRAMDTSDDCESGDENCSQRWETMIASLGAVMDSAPKDVYWGLKFFSSPQATTTTGGGRGDVQTTSRCYVSEGVEVAVGPEGAAAVRTQIAGATLATSTPTRAAVDAAVAYLSTLADSNPKYILLATDGQPNCADGSDTSGSDLDGTVASVGKALAAGYKVFVIGVGPEAATLTALAQAGGTEHFYSASSPDELATALSSIVGTVAAGCSYPVDASLVTNPNGIGVYLDKLLVPQGTTEGWSIDSTNTTITLNGTFCADVTSGVKSSVEIYLPCKPDEPLPDDLL